MTSRRLALVTGASSGIGRAIAVALVDRGYRVVGLSRREEPIDLEGFEAVAVDLGDLEVLPGRLEEVRDRLRGRSPDVVVLAAGIGRFGSLEEHSYEDLRRLVDVNYLGQAFVVRSLISCMRRRGSGHLVFVGSESALRGGRYGSGYSASKFALRGFAQALRQEVASGGLRVTTIHPGMVRTPFFENLDFGPGAEPEQALEAEDVAALVMAAVEARAGAVVDEIEVTPRVRVARRKGR